MTRDVVVLGIGGVLMGDDAVGPYVAALVSAGWALPPEVEVIDAGTPGLDLVTFLTRKRAAIIVDSVRAAAPPGSVLRYDKADLIRKPPGLRVGPHEPALKDTLLALEFAGEGPEQVIFVGVVPENVHTGTGLSPVVQQAAARAADEVVRVLAELGIEALPRVPRLAPDIWWEATASASP